MTLDSTAPPSPVATTRPDRATRGRVRRLLAAALVGSSIEWYDFFIFGTAAALALPAVFFTDQDPAIGVLLSFATFWAGFLGRPLGGILAGHFGDRYGRKPVVVVSLLTMAACTFAIGCLPGAAVLGLGAPILLGALRLIQGVACGAQYGGVVVLVIESADQNKRGFAGTFGQMGSAFGMALGTVAFLAVAAFVPSDAFLEWGWRLPFLATAVLLPVVLYIQVKIEDTPTFTELKQRVRGTTSGVTRSPLSDVLRKNGKLVLLAAGLFAANNVYTYVSFTGVLNYGQNSLGLDRNSMLTVVLIGAMIAVVGILVSGWLSDRIGRKPLVIGAAIGAAIWAFPYFWLIDAGDLTAFAVAIFVGCALAAVSYGPLAAFVSELFPAQTRLSGVSLANQLCAVTISGATPVVVTAIIGGTGVTIWVSVFMSAVVILTLICALVLRETRPVAIRNQSTTLEAVER